MCSGTVFSSVWWESCDDTESTSLWSEALIIKDYSGEAIIPPQLRKNEGGPNLQYNGSSLWWRVPPLCYYVLRRESVCVCVWVKGVALSYITKTKAISKEDNWTWSRATSWSETLKLWTHLLGCRAPCQGHRVENLPPPNTHASRLRWLLELFLIWVNLTWD